MQNINKYLSMLLVGQKLEVLEIALNLKIFKLLEEEKTLDNLALKLNINKHKTKLLLDALVYMELLENKQNIYTNTHLAKKFFIYGATSYCGDIFLYRKQMINNGRIAIKSILNNKKFEDKKVPHLWANASKLFLKQEQKHLISPLALDIVKNLKDFKSMNKMLDLACASGIIGLEIAKLHPKLKTVLFDYKEVINIAKKNITLYKLQNQVTTLSGDINKDNIGENYDLIWCSNIFYFTKDIKSLIQKIYNSLNPNGILVSCHVEIDERNSIDENSFFYFLSLNMQGKNILKPMQLSNIFEELGFKSINSYTNFNTPICQSQIHICRK